MGTRKAGNFILQDLSCKAVNTHYFILLYFQNSSLVLCTPMFVHFVLLFTLILDYLFHKCIGIFLLVNNFEIPKGVNVK